ncbi:hypothetical protein Glove_345g51 [Diversispora epigaea]|uniref:Uncharacterized protein n=1 Tax=Diversispora epigaea TaxID=1348612 RepID=A0A397HG94_9GLOM|nr:hypothetical protein Glove_345g51 [Diversispora epigaea]
MNFQPLIAELSKMIEVLPYIKCCGKPERSVMLCGNMQGLNDEQVNNWLKNTTDIPFIHVKKVHNSITEDISEFYNKYKDLIMKGPRGTEIQTRSSYYINTKRKFFECSSHPHAIYDDTENDMIHVILPTPGLQSKEDLNINLVDNEIIITARVKIPNVSGLKIIDTIPSRQITGKN